MVKQGAKAYWIMLQGELGCDQCARWKGVRTEQPCDGYDGNEADVEGGCTRWMPKEV